MKIKSNISPNRKKWSLKDPHLYENENAKIPI